MKIKSTFSTTNIILFLLVVNLMFTGGIFSYLNYSNQIKEQFDVSTNNTATEIKRLIKTIDRSDQIDDNRTKHLLEVAVNNQKVNYQALVKISDMLNSTR
jgi:hypothetical protein